MTSGRSDDAPTNDDIVPDDERRDLDDADAVEIPEHLDRPLETPEADALEQAIDEPLDDESR